MPKFTVRWYEQYETTIDAETPEEAIEKVKDNLVTHREEGENTDTFDFTAQTD